MILRGFVAVAVAACAIALSACDSANPPPTAPSAVLSNGTAIPAHAVVGAPLSGRGRESFVLLSGASVLRIRTADLGTNRYRIATPRGTGVFPIVHANASSSAVSVSLQGGGDAILTVTLNKLVPWSVQLDAGVSTLRADLSDGTLAGLSANQGISTIDLTLGRPRAAVPITEAGGVSTLMMHLPAATPVRAQISGGAGVVTLYGRTRKGISAGTTLATPNFHPPGYVVNAEAGISTLLVDATR